MKSEMNEILQPTRKELDEAAKERALKLFPKNLPDEHGMKARLRLTEESLQEALDEIDRLNEQIDEMTKLNWIDRKELFDHYFGVYSFLVTERQYDPTKAEICAKSAVIKGIAITKDRANGV